MSKKNLLSLFILIAAASIFNLKAAAQETEPAANSAITQTKLPAGAQRVLAGSVPAEINDGLQKIVEAGAGKLRQGEREVLAWSGANYKKAHADNLIAQLQNNLQKQGWNYEVGGSEGGITVFSVSKENPRRAVLGFYIPTDDALVVAWTEVLAAGNQSNFVRNDAIETTPARKSAAAGGGIVGTWTNGTTSMLGEKNLTTGAVTSRNGSTFKYVFTGDGRFESVGLTQSTMYGCTTSLFNDKRGRYEISGSQITLIPSKNFWRNTYSCSPASNKERDYVLERETYEFRTKTDEYGKTLICLANAKGESCYRRED